MRRRPSPLVLACFTIVILSATPAFCQAPGPPSSGGQSTSSGSSTGGSTAGASSSSGGGASAGAAARTTQPQQSDFNGSVPQGTASATPIALSLGDAVERGLRANLGLLTTQQSSAEVRAQRLRALSGLLPSLSGQVGETVQQINLQAVGFLFSIPGVPTIVGPYSYQSAIANATVPIFNWSSISNLRASRAEDKASVLSVKNARDIVSQAVASAYLQIIADGARVLATQAEVDADTAVYTNASRRHDAGTAIGIDVLRSQVELKQRQQALVAEKNQFQIDKLTLGRIIGLPIGQDFTVADPTPAVPIATMSLQDALAKAYDTRPDYQAAKARVLGAQFTLSASRAERYPTVQAQGFYGDEGLHEFSNSHGVMQVTGGVQFNIFDGGRIRADIEQSNAELKNRRNEMENLRGQIDFDVRSAMLNLQSAQEQVNVAKSNVELAETTRRQSQDRFAAGVTNTVEVVQAQQAVADANNNLINAQFQYNLAKVSLARALGLTEQNIKSYFSEAPGTAPVAAPPLPPAQQP